MTARGDSGEGRFNNVSPDTVNGLDLVSLSQAGKDGSDALKENEAALFRVAEAVRELAKKVMGADIKGSPYEISAAVDSYLKDDNSAYKAMKDALVRQTD